MGNSEALISETMVLRLCGSTFRTTSPIQMIFFPKGSEGETFLAIHSAGTGILMDSVLFRRSFQYKSPPL